MIAEAEGDIIKGLNNWKDNMENRGMKLNMNKTMIMISGERQKALRWPCGVCGRGIHTCTHACIKALILGASIFRSFPER